MHLVTGGAGFIGSHLVHRLVAQGEDVRVLDNFSSGNLRNLMDIIDRIDLVVGDIRDEEAVRAAVAGTSIVYHHAAAPSVQTSVDHPRLTFDANVTGTLNVLIAAKEAKCDRVVFASSCAVYGDAPTSPKTEDLAADPQSPYATSKHAGEALCANFFHLYGLQTVALRYFNVFGPGQNPHSPYSAVIPKFLDQLLRGYMPTIYGDGEQTRDFVFVENVVNANLLAARSDAAVGRVLNIGSGTPVSLNQMLRLIANLIQQPAIARYEDARPGDIRHSCADITRARELLGYEPSIGFEEGLARTICSMREAMAAPLSVPDAPADPLMTTSSARNGL